LEDRLGHGRTHSFAQWNRLLRFHVLFRLAATHSFSQEFLKLFWFIFKEEQRIVLHLWVNPFFVHILICQKSLHLIRRCLGSWLGKVAWQLPFPEAVDQVIVELLEGLNFSGGPQVEVDRLDLGDVGAETPMLA